MQQQRSGSPRRNRSAYRATPESGGLRKVGVKSIPRQSRPHLATQTIAPWVNFSVILLAGIQLMGAWRARAVSTTTSWARHIEMKMMLPIRIVFFVPKGATGRQARQVPLTGRANIVIAENTVKLLRRQVTNNALIAPPVSTATHSQQSRASRAVRAGPAAGRG